MSRGINYGSFTAAYGETVTLNGSSAASGAHCWIRINSAVNKNDGTTGERIETEAHLNLAQAIVLRAALDSFISDATDGE